MSIEITKEEAIYHLNEDAKPRNHFYPIRIELTNGMYQIATFENLEFGVKFWYIK